MKKVIEITQLSFAYESDMILEEINLSVEERDFLAIIGPNGGGKSTLLKLMLGLLKPKSGSVEIYGKRPSKALSQIGYVPQNTNVNTDFPIKVIEVVLMGHVGEKRPLWGYGEEERACAMGALAEVGMATYADRKIGDLSGGQRQRVMIARALCAHPQILLLDEITASIDIQGQKEIYELLKKLNSTMTIIVVSHDISVILGYATKAAHINRRLSYHDISDRSKTFHTHGEGEEHFCEIELLQMLGAEACHECSDEEGSGGFSPTAPSNAVQGVKP